VTRLVVPTAMWCWGRWSQKTGFGPSRKRDATKARFRLGGCECNGKAGVVAHLRINGF
jgi:hypothetical protein